MVHHALEEEEAAACFWVIDAHGLVTQERMGMEGFVRAFSRRPGGDDREGEGLLEVIKRVRLALLSLPPMAAIPQPPLIGDSARPRPHTRMHAR